MPSFKEEEYQPLQEEEYQPLQEAGDEDENYVSTPNVHKKKHPSLVAIVLIASLCLNSLMGVYIVALLLREEGKGISKFARLTRDQSVVYHGHTEFSDNNDTAADAHWDALDTHSGLITLEDDYAREKGITLGARFPWNDQKGVYWLHSSHDLHCLKLIRRSIVEYRSDRPQTQARGHINHCLDSLRQKTMCDASDQPMSTIKGRYTDTGDGMVMQCRSWDKLTAWANDVKREACFKWIDEYRTPKWLFERFAFCPESSEDYPAKEKYFEIHGHHDPWGADS